MPKLAYPKGMCMQAESIWYTANENKNENNIYVETGLGNIA